MKGVVNVFFKFSEETQKLLLLSLKEKNNLNDYYIGTEHIFLAILSMKNNHVCKLLNECNIFYKDFYGLLKKKDSLEGTNYFVFTPLMNDVFNALANSHGKKNNEILISDIIIEILNNSNSKAVLILKKLNIDMRKLLKSLNTSTKKRNIKKGILKDIGVNLNERFINSKEVVLERDEEINMIIEILCCKNKNNPILIGDAGVGKTAIVEELARRISLGDIPYKLQNKKIYSFAMSSLVAGTKYRGEFEEKINKLINEVENSDDVILFIDEIHTLVGAGGADGAIDASNILKPYLARGNIKIIGATTKEEYKKYFSNDKALSRRFQIVSINEPSKDKVRKILLGIKNNYEEYHNVEIPISIIDKIIYYSDKYINNRKFPDKAIDILDEVCVLSSIFYNKEYNVMINLDKEIKKIVDLKNKVLLNGDFKQAIKYSHDEKLLQQKMGKARKTIFNHQKTIKVSEESLLKVMERKTNIPFYTYKYERNKIKKKINKYKKISIFSENIIEKTIDYTNEFYTNIVNTSVSNHLYVRSSKYGLNNYFIDEYINNFFDKCNLIRIDINNFRNIDDLLRDNDIYNKGSSFIDKIKNELFSVIVIDNINNADYSIVDFFQKINKYGYYIDKNNEKVVFSNVLFIYNVINNDKIGFNNKIITDKSKYYIDVENIVDTNLKKKIRKLCSNNNFKVNIKVINKIFDKIIMDMNNLNNIDFLIRKELSNLDNSLNKNETIKI